jgi:hypothetical protein
MFCPNCGAERTKIQHKCEVCGESFDLEIIEKIAQDPLMEENLVGQEIAKNETFYEDVHLATLEEKSAYESLLIDKAKREVAAAEERKRLDLLKKKKWVLIILGLAFCIVLVSLGYLLYLYNTPKYVYLKAESRYFFEKHEDLNKKFERELELQRVIDSEPSNLKGTIKANFMVEGELNFEEQIIYRMIQGLISNSEINFNTNLDPKKNKLYSNIKLKNADNTIFNLKLIEDSNRVALSTKLLGEKYLYTSKNEFGNTLKNVNENYSGPEKVSIVNNNSISPWIQISGEEVVLLSDYGKEFFNALENKDIKLIEDQKLVFEDKSINGDVIEIKIDEKKFKKIATRMLDRLENDSRLYDTVEKRLAVLESINNVKINNEKISRDSIIKNLKKQIKQSKNNIKNVNFTDDLVHKVYLDKNKKIIARELVLPIEDNKFTYVNIEKNSETINDFSNSKLEFRFESKVYEKNKGLFTENRFKFTNIGDERESIIFSTVTRIDNLNEYTVKTHTNFSFESNTATGTTLPTFEGYIDRTLYQNLEKNFSNEDIVFNIGVDTAKDDNVDLFAISLMFNRDYKIRNGVNIPLLTSENSLNANKLSDKETKEIYKNFQEVTEDFIKNIGAKKD